MKIYVMGEKNMKKMVRAILTYLSGFKDAKGNEADPFKVAVLIQEYCELQIEELNKSKS